MAWQRNRQAAGGEGLVSRLRYRLHWQQQRCIHSLAVLEAGRPEAARAVCPQRAPGEAAACFFLPLVATPALLGL